MPNVYWVLINKLEREREREKCRKVSSRATRTRDLPQVACSVIGIIVWLVLTSSLLFTVNVRVIKDIEFIELE